jgi:hypothetical protein
LLAPRSPDPAAKRFVQAAFRIGCAMRKALSIRSALAVVWFCDLTHVQSSSCGKWNLASFDAFFVIRPGIGRACVRNFSSSALALGAPRSARPCAGSAVMLSLSKSVR